MANSSISKAEKGKSIAIVNNDDCMSKINLLYLLTPNCVMKMKIKLKHQILLKILKTIL